MIIMIIIIIIISLISLSLPFVQLPCALLKSYSQPLI